MALDWSRTTKLDQYLAAIRYDLARHNPRIKDPDQLELKNFLLKFDTQAQEPRTMTPEDKLKAGIPLTKEEDKLLRKQRTEKSKAAWSIALATAAHTSKDKRLKRK
jgi:hypothetical protein